MSRDVVGPFLLTVTQFLVAAAVFVGVGELVGGSENGDLVVGLSVVFAVTAVTWGYWQVTGGGWGISYREYKRRTEEGEAEPASGPGYGSPGGPGPDRESSDAGSAVPEDRPGGDRAPDGDGGSGVGVDRNTARESDDDARGSADDAGRDGDRESADDAQGPADDAGRDGDRGPADDARGSGDDRPAGPGN